VLNIDELSARVKCLRREHVIILAEVIKLYIASLKNKKSITIVETICCIINAMGWVGCNII